MRNQLWSLAIPQIGRGGRLGRLWRRLTVSVSTTGLRGSFVGLGAVACLLSGAAFAQPLGTAFTYQGQLTESAQPATGLYDLQICLFDTPVSAMPISCAADFDDVPVEDGLFTLALDFGAAPFVGQARYLELRVRAGASAGAYTVLAPRQLIRAAPEALRATAAAAAPWSGLTGIPSGFADGVDNDSGGTVTSITAGTGLSGGTITGSGNIGIADGGVGSAQLAPGAVGLTQIDTAQVQARIGGRCERGEYARGVNPDGSVLCDSLLSYLGINLSTLLDGPPSGLGPATAIAIGADGRPVISYAGLVLGRNFLKVAQCNNSVCTGGATISVVSNPSNSVGSDSDIAIGLDALPVISYRDETAGALKVAKCADAACSGAQISTVDDPINLVGVDTAIAIGSDGAPIISYADTSAGALKVAKCANAACTGTATINVVDDPANPVGTFSDIAIGNDGLPVISYFEAGNANLRVAKCANPDCAGSRTITIVDSTGSAVGRYTSIAVPSDGLPVISYAETFTLGDARRLKVAKCANPSCTGSTTTIVDEPAGSNVGVHTSIAIGSDGLPVISYRDETAGALKVAKCDNADCTLSRKTTIDDIGNAGFDTSIAIGADGFPVISHRDAAGALRVLKCATASCQ